MRVVQLDWFSLWPWLPARYRGEQAVSVRAEVIDDGVTLRMEATDGARLTLVVRARPPVEVRLNGRAIETWSMVAGLPVGLRDDPFRTAYFWARDAMSTSDSGDLQPNAIDRQTLAALYSQVRALAINAARRCEPKARALALRFLPDMRWKIYRAILGDASGRIGELALTSPGALIFAFALDTIDGAPGRDAASRFLDGVIAGRRLQRMLGDLVDAWRTIPRIDDPTDDISRPWPRVWNLVKIDRPRLLDEQRLLVRRAGPLVPMTCLPAPPPLGFAPEDIPSSIRPNALWYVTVKCHISLLAARRNESARTCTALARFVSLNVLALRKAMPASIRPLWSIRVLSNWALAERVTLVRHERVAAVLERCHRWYRQTYRDCEDDELVEFPDDTKLATPSLAALETEDFRIRPLTTAGELRREGDEMDNCVGSYVARARRGAVALYSAFVEGRRLTVALEKSASEWTLAEIAATRNAPATPEEERAVERWLDGAHPPSPGGN